MLKRILLWLLSLTVLAGLGLTGAAYWFISRNQPTEDIGPESLKKILAVESPVFYRDGVSKVGVIFQDSHRQYLPYARIPPLFVKAIVAAEDHNFFSHHGVDVLGVARAMLVNLKAGRVVQGGSTLTQQAAKNLFKREGRSLQAKAKELMYAWRLEAHYPKEKILEFYANQFYVSGNGLGLGVAAKYYFDKNAEDLTLVENAFIAGSVKRPNAYNPFIKHDEQTAAAARQRARERTAYVLGQMRDLGMITEAERAEAVSQEIPFKQGQMSFAVNTVMDVVKDALAEPEVEQALENNGIDSVAGSGIRIITTVDRELQTRGLAATREELSRVSVLLQGYDQHALQPTYQKLAEEKMAIEEGAFLFGRVLQVQTSPQPAVEVALGDTAVSGVVTPVVGVIDQEGLNDLLEAQAKYLGQRFSKGDRQATGRLLETMREGDLVYVGLRLRQADAKSYLLSLHKYPDIQGAVIAVREGKIVAMIGGSENRFFNRAMDARRPMGSVVKPMVYSAALQLGWNPADLLSNQRQAFVYQNQEYYPRPDHQSPYAWVSMSWAGVKSENLASVWLLYHLCDRLSPGQFKELLGKVGMDRAPEESYQQYAARIRDSFGILINDQALRRLAFERAVELIGPDLVFDAKMAENELLHRFNYQLEGRSDSDDKAAEREVRRQAVRHTFVDQQRYYRQLQVYRAQVEAGAEPEGFGDSGPEEGEAPPVQAHLFAGPGGHLFAESAPGLDWRPMGAEDVAAALRGTEGGEFWDSVILDGLLSAGTFRQLTELVGQEFQRLSALPPYDPAVLHQVRDFRVLAGIRYLIALLREMGVSSPLEPVLSFPLGSNVISLIEVARAYETMVTGLNYRTGQAGAEVPLMIIERIEDSDGRLIYQPERQAKRVLDGRHALGMSDILKNVVKYGTGRYARTRIRLHSADPKREAALGKLKLELPLLGKTGTANDFRNSSFAGFLPEVAEDGTGLEVGRGYAVAAYEGYDDNSVMSRNSSRISGAAGGLVLWSELVDAIVSTQGYSERLKLDSLSFSADIELPLRAPDLGQITAAEGTVSSLASQVGDPAVLSPAADRGQNQIGPSVLTFGEIGKGGELVPAREFKPYWGDLQ